MVATDEQILDVIERSGLLDTLARGSVIWVVPVPERAWQGIVTR